VLSYSHYSEPLPGGGAVPFLISWESDSPARYILFGSFSARVHTRTLRGTTPEQWHAANTTQHGSWPRARHSALDLVYMRGRVGASSMDLPLPPHPLDPHTPPRAPLRWA